jgi:hypothetical protein
MKKIVTETKRLQDEHSYSLEDAVKLQERAFVKYKTFSGYGDAIAFTKKSKEEVYDDFAPVDDGIAATARSPALRASQQQQRHSPNLRRALPMTQARTAAVAAAAAAAAAGDSGVNRIVTHADGMQTANI